MERPCRCCGRDTWNQISIYDKSETECSLYGMFICGVCKHDNTKKIGCFEFLVLIGKGVYQCTSIYRTYHRVYDKTIWAKVDYFG